MPSLYEGKREGEFLNPTAMLRRKNYFNMTWFFSTQGNVVTGIHLGKSRDAVFLKNVVTSVWPADSRLSCFWRILFMRSKNSPFPLATLEKETNQFSCGTFHPCLHLITQCGFKKGFPSSRVWEIFFFSALLHCNHYHIYAEKLIWSSGVLLIHTNKIRWTTLRDIWQESSTCLCWVDM